MSHGDYATWSDYVAVWLRHGNEDAWRFARENLTGPDLDKARRLHDAPANRRNAEPRVAAR